jgi:uncharacterized protein YdeI (YjbR/CyaY-like superfamily)
MPPKPLPTDLPVRSFSCRSDFEAFLEREHATAPGLYLQLAKKGSAISSVSAAEAVEVALCFGWIDGRAHGVDDSCWLSRYTPRRPKSMWSRKNVDTIARLMDEGRIRPAGIAAVDAAKADGRWERAYAGPATITVPDDLAASLAVQPTALAFFQSLNKSDRYSVLWRVETASPTSRARRVQTLVDMLAVGKVPGATPPTSKPRRGVGPRRRVAGDAPELVNPYNSKATEEGSGSNVPPTVRSRREGLRRRT